MFNIFPSVGKFRTTSLTILQLIKKHYLFLNKTLINVKGIKNFSFQLRIESKCLDFLKYT